MTQILLGALYCGSICVIGQYIYDHTNLTAGHITSIFVVCGVLLDLFDIYDKILEYCGIGASLPITSFGHSLIHATMESMQANNLMGLFKGTFGMTTPGITAAIVFSFLIAIIFKAKD